MRTQLFWAMVGTCIWTGVAHAVPVVVLRDEFAALQSGRTVIVEDFQGFDPIGVLPSPVQLTNGTFSAIQPQIAQLSDGSRMITSANS
jgi:hypothetical protein